MSKSSIALKIGYRLLVMGCYPELNFKNHDSDIIEEVSSEATKELSLAFGPIGQQYLRQVLTNGELSASRMQAGLHNHDLHTIGSSNIA